MTLTQIGFAGIDVTPKHPFRGEMMTSFRNFAASVAALGLILSPVARAAEPVRAASSLPEVGTADALAPLTADAKKIKQKIKVEEGQKVKIKDRNAQKKAQRAVQKAATKASILGRTGLIFVGVFGGAAVYLIVRKKDSNG